MNKYEEALWFFINRKSENLPDIEIEDTEDRKHFLVLAELVEKATPMKVKNTNYCPICRELVVYEQGMYAMSAKFCPICGQALDWGNENEN